MDALDRYFRSTLSHSPCLMHNDRGSAAALKMPRRIPLTPRAAGCSSSPVPPGVYEIASRVQTATASSPSCGVTQVTSTDDVVPLEHGASLVAGHGHRDAFRNPGTRRGRDSAPPSVASREES